MHPAANEVDVSTDEVEKYLLQWAKPGFTGQRVLHLRVKEEAGRMVFVLPESSQVDRVKGDGPLSPDAFRHPSQPDERENLVRTQLAKNKYRFRIGMRLNAVLANFNDGRLTGFEWKTVG